MPRNMLPCSVKTMKDTEAAWLAGFFDGEGSMSLYTREGIHPYWTMGVNNTNQDSLLKCQAISGAGVIRLTKPLHKVPIGHKAQYEWRIRRLLDMESLCKQMLPYLTIKKPKALELLTWLKNH